MAKTQIELYDALRPHIGEEGARLIAEVVPVSELVTKEFLRSELNDVKSEFNEFKAETRRWMLTFFAPLWIGVYLTLGAIVVSIFVGR